MLHVLLYLLSLWSLFVLVARVGDGDAAAAGARVGVAVLPPADTYVVMYGI